MLLGGFRLPALLLAIVIGVTTAGAWAAPSASAASAAGTAPAARTAATAVTAEQAIQQILRETNALRAAAGKPALIRAPSMDTVAMNWSAAQGKAGTLKHNPNYTTQIPAGWTKAAENVASGYTVDTVVTGWRNSPGHYANMIGDYTHIGIGYYESGGQRYFTQNFGKYSAAKAPPGVAAAPPVTIVPTAPPAPHPVVQGNRLVDAVTGRDFTAHAVNWPSFEYACQQGWAYSSGGATAAAATAMTRWGITAVRLPLNEACWLGVDGSPAYGTTAGYRAAIRAFVDVLNAAGLVVILDLHWNAPAGYAAAGQRPMADARSATFWQQVATAYAGVPAVMFDAFNEPYSRWNPAGTGLAFTLTWACWRDGGCQAPVENDESASLSGATYPVTGMATLVAAIRSAGATQPILLAGLDYANDMRGWLANRPADDQLVASWHNYPGQRCSNATCWNAEIAPLAAEVPVIATEFGQTDGGSAFLTSFMDWADAAHIGYAPWAWWAVSASESLTASRYALVTDTTTFTPKAPAGTAYNAHLVSLMKPPVPRTPPPATSSGAPPAAARVGTYLSSSRHEIVGADCSATARPCAGRGAWMVGVAGSATGRVPDERD